MKIISETSDADIARSRARDELGWPLRKLTANLLRIVGGAGSPGQIVPQLNALTDAIIEYQTAFDAAVSDDAFRHALSIDEEDRLPWAVGLDEESAMMLRSAKKEIVRGALRRAAATLLGQEPHVRLIDCRLRDSVYSIVKLREERSPKARAAMSPKTKRQPKDRAGEC